MSRSQRCLALLVLMALVSVQATWGRAPANRPQPVRLGVVPQALAFAFQVFGLPSGWQKEGCMVDPYGRCLPKDAPTRGGFACATSFDKECAPASNVEVGCMVDPYGRCLPGH